VGGGLGFLKLLYNYLFPWLCFVFISTETLYKHVLLDINLISIAVFLTVLHIQT
jgi:hypothetical protein